MSEIILYETSDRKIKVEVKLDGNTVWLTQKQMAEIFQTTPQNITLHLKRVYKDQEIEQEATCKEYLQVQKEGKRAVERRQMFYNLDAIISVGYRINSKRGTQFRQWATKRLKDYLILGYSINQKRLNELNRLLTVVEQSAGIQQLQLEEAKGLLSVLGSYTKSFILLNQYDSATLPVEKLNENITYEINYDEAISAIKELKKELADGKNINTFLVTKRMIALKVHYGVSYKLSTGNISIQA